MKEPIGSLRLANCGCRVAWYFRKAHRPPPPRASRLDGEPNPKPPDELFSGDTGAPASERRSVACHAMRPEVELPWDALPGACAGVCGELWSPIM